jgi:polyphenol oxidase
MSGLIVPQWAAPSRVHAVSTTRGIDSNVLAQVAGLPATPRWLTQVHGTQVLDLDCAAQDSTADAAISRVARTVCAIRTADCLPVLFAARDGSCVGAAHAGWRGLAAGVLENTAAAMRVPSGELLAWLGPAIGPTAFEVGDEVRAAFIAHDPAAAAAFQRNARARWLCDLFALARQRLAAVGVAEVSGGGVCTYGDSQRFHSYRRDASSERMVSLIWLD